MSSSSAARTVLPSLSVTFVLRRLFALCGLLFFGLSATAATLPPPPPIVVTFTDLDLERTYTAADLPDVGWTVGPGDPSAYTVTVSYIWNKRAMRFPRFAGTNTVKVVVTDNAPVAPLTKKRTVTFTKTFTIKKAPLTVIAQPKGRLIGAANPALTFAYEGFLNGETTITKRPVATTTAKTTSPVGTYPITVVGGSDVNYEITTRVPANLTVTSFASGTYEALLMGDFGDSPVGKVEVTLPTKGTVFTGKLNVDSEPILYSFKSALVLASDYTSATGVATINRPATRTTSAYQYLITVTIDATNTLTLGVERTGIDAQTYNLGANAKINTHVAKTNPAPWAGVHTFALLDPTPSPISLSFDYPQGIGYATATIGANGALTLRGKLADDTTLAATLYSSANGAYLVYVRPYGPSNDSRLRSDLSGSFQVIPHPTLPNRYYVPRHGGEATNILHWRKEEKTTLPLDKIYPDGIEELYLSVALDPWTIPFKGKAATKTALALDPITLAQLLGIADTHGVSADFDITYGTAHFGDWDNLGYIPYRLTLTTGSLVRLPTYFTTNPASWKMSVNATNGLFSGSFSLKDEVFGIVKPVPRTVRFQGILRQHSESDAEYPFGGGYLLLDALPDYTGGKEPPVSHPVILRPVTPSGF